MKITVWLFIIVTNGGLAISQQLPVLLLQRHRLVLQQLAHPVRHLQVHQLQPARQPVQQQHFKNVS